MADSKVTALTELTAFTGDETFYVVEDDDGTPASRRMTIENLASGLAARTELTGAFAPLGDTAWTVVGSGGGAPAFTNSWVAGNNGVHNDPRFRKIAGVVYLDGYGVTGAANSSMFTLPTGYRPSARMSLPVVNGSNVISYVNIDADGTVKPASGGANGSQIACCFALG